MMMKELYPNEYAECLAFLERLKKMNEDGEGEFRDGYTNVKLSAYTWMSVYAPETSIGDAWDLVHEIVTDFLNMEITEPTGVTVYQ